MDGSQGNSGNKNPSVLGPTLKFKGELTANEDLLIQGQVEGSIDHSSKLTIGKEGKLKANVKAEYISVEGRVDGDLAGSKSVVVTESADISGNIYSPKVTLHEGSTFNGRIDMSGKEQPAAKAPERAQEAANEEPAPTNNKDASNKNRSASAA